MTARLDRVALATALAGSLALSSALAVAAAREPEPPASQPSSTLRPETELVQGWELMTPAERESYRQSLQRAPTAADREALRREHRREIEQRARERGVELGEPHPMEINRPVSSQPEPPVRSAPE